MEQEIKLIPERIDVVIHSDGKSAVGTSFPNKEKKYKIQEIMLGMDDHRKAIPWTDKFLSEHTGCRAELLENGRLRII